MRPRVQFSLQGLMAAVAVVAVLLSLGRLVGGEPTVLAAGLIAAVLLSALLCQSGDAELVPAGLCGVLVACLIGFPPLVVDLRQLVDLWEGTLVVAILWDMVTYRPMWPGTDAHVDCRRSPPSARSRRAFPTTRLLRGLALATAAGGFVLLAYVAYAATGRLFWQVAGLAWQEWGFGWSVDDGTLHHLCGALRDHWPILALAAIGIAAAVRVRLAAQKQDEELLTRQVASAHVIGLLLLAVSVLRGFYGAVNCKVDALLVYYFAPLVDALVCFSALACLLAVSLVVLGRGARGYLRDYGWMLGLGLGAAALSAAIYVGGLVTLFPVLR